MAELGSLERAALAHAFASVEGGAGPLIPFVMIEVPGGMELVRIVTGTSDQAFVLGHRLIRAGRADARAYCLVVEAYLRIDGERVDAFLLEHGQRGDACGRRHAQRFRTAADGACEPAGAPLLVEEIRSAFEPLDPFALAWGAVTPDLITRDGVALHVVNHDLEAPAALARTLRFLRARLRHHAAHLPAGQRQAVHVDDRGRPVAPAQRAAIRAALAADAAFVAFSTEAER